MRQHLFIPGLLFLIIQFPACKPEPEQTSTSNRIELSGITVDSLGFRDAIIGTTMTILGNSQVSQHGHCWDILENPNIQGDHTSLGSKTATGLFTSQLLNLDPNTGYFIRAYATSNGQTIYGNQIEIHTLKTGKPLIITSGVSNITSISALCGGTVASDSGLAVTSRGVCWDTFGNPTLTNNAGYTLDGSGNGIFNSIMPGLNIKQPYYVVAYAVNEAGTSYGEIKNFETFCDPPIVVTGLIGIIHSTSLLVENNVILIEGVCDYIEKGICWSRTIENPTLENCDSHIVSEWLFEEYDVTVVDLLASTNYWLRAYASNEDTTGYGAAIQCETPGPCEGMTSFTITHDAGSVAPVTKTVTYGLIESSLTGSPKCWITQNLGADHQATSATDTTEAAAGWYWQFNRKQGFKHNGMTRTPNTAWIYGIYEDSDWAIINDPCNLLFEGGWRIPTNTEWYNAEINGSWNNLGDTYASLIKLHAAGNLYSVDGSLSFRGTLGFYWSSKQITSDSGFNLYILSDNITAGQGFEKHVGQSIRCIKD